MEECSVFYMDDPNSKISFSNVLVYNRLKQPWQPNKPFHIIIFSTRVFF